MTSKYSNILSPDTQGFEDTTQEYVRPNEFIEFIGQKQMVSNLRVFIDSAVSRDSTLDHILFYGPPGLGKTTIANIVAKSMGVEIQVSSGPAIGKIGDIAAILTSLSKGDILFIDEIHRLSSPVEETLYSAMEDFSIDIIMGEGVGAKSLRIDVPHFTLIGATTRQGMLSKPLQDRFGISLPLNLYSSSELQDIIIQTAKTINVKIDKDAALEIASRSRGTPRIANRLLRRTLDFMIANKSSVIDLDIAKHSLTQLGVDSYGLDYLDIKYLTVILKYYNGGPVGLESIAASINESKETIEKIVEPFLMQNGFVLRKSKGRVATEKASKHLAINIINT